MPKVNREQSNQRKPHNATEENHQEEPCARVIENAGRSDNGSERKRRRRQAGQKNGDARPSRHFAFEKFKPAGAHQLMEPFFAAFSHNKIEYKNTRG
jgi:hypothetical protein